MKVFLTILMLLPVSGIYSQRLQVHNLRCEYRTNPLGVDVSKPRLSWEMQSTDKNVVQTAYRVLVANDSLALTGNLGNTWDSKKLTSSQSIQVTYNGGKLLPAQKYFWKVTVWDNKGQVAHSKIFSWQMGLLSKADWKDARWIGYEEIIDSLRIVPHMHQNGKRSWGTRRNVLPMLRKEFSANKSVKRATAFICGLGHFELSINGDKIGDHFLDPGWTNYSKHALYVSFDVTKNVLQGKNAIGVMLGNGFYYIPGQRYRKMTGAFGQPKMIFRMIVEYSDGSEETIVSDDSWKTAPSPVIFSSIFGGEDYDATLRQPGWDRPGFNDLSWKNVLITTGPRQLNSQLSEPVKMHEQFEPVAKKQLRSGYWVYDLGQNFSGVPSIRVSGRKGDTVRIIPAELVSEDGAANQRASGGPSYFTYILNGDETETWTPRFSYYGFRYLQVNCIAKDNSHPGPIVKQVLGIHIRNAAPRAGTFTSSSALFNKTNELIDWAIKSNTVSVFTDCPHREKLGWLEQTHLMGASVQYNYDIASLARKLVQDMIHAQTAEGLVPEIAPEFVQFTEPFRDSPEWGSAAIIFPWYVYKWYGDREIIKEAYPMMKKYISYLESKADSNILSHGLGDWFDLGPNRPGFSQLTPAGVTATAIYYYDLGILQKIAVMLGIKKDAVYYSNLAAKVKRSFNRKFFDKTKKYYASGSQTANAMALYMNLTEPANRQAVINNLVNDIRSRGNALTAGDIGYRYLLRALEDAGRSDVIFDMNSRDDVPGYGYQLKQGATALTESWQALPTVSNNHFMLGHLMEWFYAGLCGIRQADHSAGFKEIVIQPQPVGNISQAAASYQSIYGPIKTEWKRESENFELEVMIPCNTKAKIILPPNDKYLQPISIGSGSYRFAAKLK